MNLAHQRVVLSASYPNAERNRRYLQVADSSRRVAEAIIPLASLLIRNGATIVYGGHPGITRLLAGVVSNFSGAGRQLAEVPSNVAPEGEALLGKVVLYQSAAFTAIAEVDWLRSSPFVSVTDVPIAPEEANQGRDCSPLQYGKSLQRLRERILTDSPPTAFVCVGGMEGVEAELRQFVEYFPQRPIFVYATTGGASQLIAERSQSSRVIVVDRESAFRTGTSDATDDWAFSSQELAELGPYTTSAFAICRSLSARL